MNATTVPAQTICGELIPMIFSTERDPTMNRKQLCIWLSLLIASVEYGVAAPARAQDRGNQKPNVVLMFASH